MAPSSTSNGQRSYGDSLIDGLVEESHHSDKTSLTKNVSKHDKLLKTFRLLVADLCQQFGGGHPG